MECHTFSRAVSPSSTAAVRPNLKEVVTTLKRGSCSAGAVRYLFDADHDVKLHLGATACQHAQFLPDAGVAFLQQESRSTHLTMAFNSSGPAKFNASENSLMTPSWM